MNRAGCGEPVLGDPRPAYREDDTLPAMESDGELLRRLRAGDERAFVTLVERYNGAMLRLALSFVPSRAVAEEFIAIEREEPDLRESLFHEFGAAIF